MGPALPRRALADPPITAPLHPVAAFFVARAPRPCSLRRNCAAYEEFLATHKLKTSCSYGFVTLLIMAGLGCQHSIGHKITCDVIDSSNDAPLSGVTIRLNWRPVQGSRAPILNGSYGETDRGGQRVLDNIPGGGNLALVFSKPGYHDATLFILANWTHAHFASIDGPSGDPTAPTSIATIPISLDPPIQVKMTRKATDR